MLGEGGQVEMGALKATVELAHQQHQVLLPSRRSSMAACTPWPPRHGWLTGRTRPHQAAVAHTDETGGGLCPPGAFHRHGAPPPSPEPHRRTRPCPRELCAPAPSCALPRCLPATSKLVLQPLNLSHDVGTAALHSAFFVYSQLNYFKLVYNCFHTAQSRSVVPRHLGGPGSANPVAAIRALSISAELRPTPVARRIGSALGSPGTTLSGCDLGAPPAATSSCFAAPYHTRNRHDCRPRPHRPAHHRHRPLFPPAARPVH